MAVANAYLLLLFGITIGAEAARILAFYPLASISHQIVFRPITLELLERGHDVTVITTDPMFPNGNGPANLKEIDIHDVSYAFLRRFFAQMFTGKPSDIMNQLHLVRGMYAALVEEQTRVEAFKRLLQLPKDTFDLLVLEGMCTSGLALTHKFDAPTILISSFGPFPGSYETVGAPTFPIIYHHVSRHKLYNLTTWEKLSVWYDQIRISLIVNDDDETENQILKRVFGPDIPPVNSLRDNVDMLLLNINPIWEGNHPVPPNVIHMGGLHQKPPKELPKDLQNYLDSSKNGVIYFSLGTNVKPSMLPAEKIVIFENVFADLPYNILWKWDDGSYSAKSDNVRMSKWLPQSDLLRHPNVKLFITQGGLQSTDEAITAGVPLIGIPMLGDQWYNVEKYVHHRIGIKLDMATLSEQELRGSIKEIIENESYRKNIAHLRSLMQDQPQTPLERSIWWIEYVLRHKGAKHLRAPAANMPWAEYLELDLVCVLLLGIFVILGLTIVTIRLIIRGLFPKRKVKKA